MICRRSARSRKAVAARRTANPLLDLVGMGILERHADKFEPTAYGCWIWTAAVAGGGGRPMVGIAGNRIQVVARLLCEEVYGPAPPGKPLALHNTTMGCLGGLCVNPAHLRWGSRRENTMDIPPAVRAESSRQSWAKNKNPRNVCDERTYASATGELTYLTGKPCKRGHTGPHRTRSGECIECVNLRNSLRYTR